METFKSSLGELFEKAEGDWSRKTVEEIWSFGPRRCGPNVLINRIPGQSLCIYILIKIIHGIIKFMKIEDFVQ